MQINLEVVKVGRLFHLFRILRARHTALQRDISLNLPIPLLIFSWSTRALRRPSLTRERVEFLNCTYSEHFNLSNHFYLFTAVTGTTLAMSSVAKTWNRESACETEDRARTFPLEKKRKSIHTQKRKKNVKAKLHFLMLPRKRGAAQSSDTPLSWRNKEGSILPRAYKAFCNCVQAEKVHQRK